MAGSCVWLTKPRNRTREATPSAAASDSTCERSGPSPAKTRSAFERFALAKARSRSSGRFQAWKRPLDLLRAFARANLSNALLVFAGEGPLRSQVESEAAALGVASRVRFLGFVNQTQLPAMYASADLLVLPSEYEPFAVVVNEAMCCGCAVVVSDRVGAARDLVAPVAPQFVFPCGDIDALASILEDAVTDRLCLQSVARAVLAHIRTWSPESNIAATIDAIRIAVARAGRFTSESLPESSSPHTAPAA